MFGCRLLLVAALAGTACGVTAPARVDLAALVKRLGPIDARHELELRIVKDPKDVAALLALAKLAEDQGRPSQALTALDAVVQLGGPVGTRWRTDDRARLDRLLAARGRARTARGAPTAIADLRRARELGARVTDDELARAALARALVQLRHIDRREHAKGLATLRELARSPSGRGLALPGLPDSDVARGRFGAWLWQHGAKRAAVDALTAWHDATRAPRDEVLQAHYLAARAWWTPVDAPPPAASELVGPIRCRYVSCKPADLVRDAVRSDAIDALLLAPPVRTGDPEAAAAWLAITLAQALRREGDWATLFAARVNVDSLAVDRLPPWARDAYAIVTARRGDGARESGADLPLAGHLLAAAVAVHRGRSPAEVRALLGSLAETPEGNALLAIATPPPTSTAAQNRRATALARYIAARRATAVADVVELERADAMLRAYRRDPLVADRIADEIVASHVDAAVGHAWVATAFGVVRDPARARARWQAAVDLSPAEPALSRGLAEAIARANDPDAALVAATHAAAASGDPGPVWIAISNALHGVGADVHALEAARYAIDLASTEHAAAAFEAAIAASEALGRRAQAAALRTRRANVAPPVLTASMLAESHDDAWRATRWHPRDVASRAALLAALPENDVRRGILADELVVLAGDADPARGLAAFDALAELAELDH